MKDKAEFLILRSSAGSGKTYSLVKHYLAFLLTGDQMHYHRFILAITFTNKATNEMKERIIGYLSDLADDNEEGHLIEELSDLTALDAKEIKHRSQRLIDELLHSYGDFNISTIDKFVLRIIKSFAYELNINTGSEIELREDRLVQRVVDQLFAKVFEDETLKKILIRFANYKMESGDGFQLENELTALSKEVMLSGGSKILKFFLDFDLVAFEQKRTELHGKLNVIRSGAKEIADRGMKVFHENNIQKEDISQPATGPYAFFERYAGKQAQFKLATSHVTGVLTKGKWNSGKAGSEIIPVIESVSAELEALLKQLIDYVESHYETFKFCELMAKHIHAMALINEVNRSYHEVLEQFNINRLEDYNRMIAEVVSDNPAPFIYERIGERFQHYLLDEFQDTSVIQWYNLIPLVNNALAGGNDSLVVGDAKQAIYRWRGGELEQLDELPEFRGQDMPIDVERPDDHAIQSMARADLLDSNFRSSQIIVNFNNALFDQLLSAYPTELDKIYQNHRQNPFNQLDEGSVEVYFTDEKSEEEHLQITLEKIEQFKNLGYKYTDMAVLCRTKKWCSSIADLLAENNVPFTSSESMKLEHSAKVNFIVNWYEYVLGDQSARHAFKICKFLVDQKKVQLSESDFIEWWLLNHKLDQFLLDFDVPLNPDKLRKEHLLEMANMLIHEFFVDETSDPYLIAFKDYLMAYINRFGNDKQEFLIWWRENQNDFVVEFPNTADAVNLMTIHKSKGLEFKVVIWPFAWGDIVTSKKVAWTETSGADRDIFPYAMVPLVKELNETRYGALYEEERRLSFIDTCNVMYVALTRAKEHLCVLSVKKKGREGERSIQAIMWQSLHLKALNKAVVEDHFFYGNQVPSQEATDASEKSEFVYNVEDLKSWKNRLILKYRSDQFESSFDSVESKEVGLLYHEILSKMNDLSELNAILNQYVFRNLMSAEQASKMEVEIKEVLEREDLIHLFHNLEGEIMNEREILNSDGKRFRPDRCVINNNQVTVIDYKTGSFNPEHEAQVRQYVNLFNDMGYDHCEGILIYLISGDIVKVA